MKFKNKTRLNANSVRQVDNISMALPKPLGRSGDGARDGWGGGWGGMGGGRQSTTS